MEEIVRKAIFDKIRDIETTHDYQYVNGMIDMAWTLGAVTKVERLALKNKAVNALYDVIKEAV